MSARPFAALHAAVTFGLRVGLSDTHLKYCFRRRLRERYSKEIIAPYANGHPLFCVVPFLILPLRIKLIP